ncbi:myelin protein P0-like [Sparus aurata]|uniref:myelin protein P0-like n=1 Tax=Sparus aurata TaxID=8175 RepID=UPI0011C1CBB5|nr:myelin protein P0-like [Sparus aurata]XP_030248463.1 myelin protein P0-like [Sparus aurata]
MSLSSSSLSWSCAMKTCSRSALMLLKLMYITLLPVLKSQDIKVPPEVTGYVGHDVTLPCQFIQGQKDIKITQVQWSLKPPEGKEIIIIVSSSLHGVNVPETFLKGRVEIEEQSLMIRDVEKGDAGSYTCSIATFPSGSFEGTTNLVVQEQMPLSSGVVSAVVIAVFLLLGILAAIAYLIFIRRPFSTVRHRVHIDTCGPVRDATRPSVIVKQEDVVYADVNVKPSRDRTPSSSDKPTDVAHDGVDVTYSEVFVSRQQHV